MQSNISEWSITEQEIARKALIQAYTRETEALITEIRAKAGQITEINDIWSLHDYLSTKRYDIDGKYDERDLTPIFALAQLIKEGWLLPNDLTGLAPDKKAKISALAKMG
jgi:Photoprotection regulator fluorescence recovery protein